MGGSELGHFAQFSEEDGLQAMTTCVSHHLPPMDCHTTVYQSTSDFVDSLNLYCYVIPASMHLTDYKSKQYNF